MYAEWIKELDSILERLESGSLPLEEALTLYEAGRNVINRCQTHLDEAQARILSINAS